LQLARIFGMNYVHIPIGYDGVNEDQSRSLVRVAREAKRPIYVHCHHGRHRGPTAAALICLEEGAVTVNRALSLMNKSGTSKDYAGLWESMWMTFVSFTVCIPKGWHMGLRRFFSIQVP
ncbi:hypothetical protein N8843_01490, partial [Verrucomicrobia bacterium]|nr:hypothetical protein [Verrucomicrobiota bacterium]